MAEMPNITTMQTGINNHKKGLHMMSADSIYSWANWVLVGALVVGLVATYAIVVTGKVRDDALKAELETQRARSAALEAHAEEQRRSVAEANAKAESFRLEIAKANEQAGLAGVEAATANESAAKANERAAEIMKATACRMALIILRLDSQHC